jgi:hypothetical protein
LYLIQLKDEYPQMEYKNKIYIGLDRIIECIDDEMIDREETLSKRNQADMLAFLTLFKKKFIPAFVNTKRSY